MFCCSASNSPVRPLASASSPLLVLGLTRNSARQVQEPRPHFVICLDLGFRPIASTLPGHHFTHCLDIAQRFEYVHLQMITIVIERRHDDLFASAPCDECFSYNHLAHLTDTHVGSSCRRSGAILSPVPRSSALNSDRVYPRSSRSRHQWCIQQYCLRRSESA